MSIEKEIQESILRKHDIALRLRRIVIDPITKMNRPDTAEQEYFENEGENNTKYLRNVEIIRNEFSRKWNDESKPVEDQKEQIDIVLGKVKTDYVPMIKQLAVFYQHCLNKGFYFKDTPNGKSAEESMKRSISFIDDQQTKTYIEELCEDLLSIGSTFESSETITFNLLACLQDVLDDIDAHVTYTDELEVSKVICTTDRKALRDHVLMNIQENINTHAFGTAKFKGMHVWERKVKVTVSDEAASGTILIDIKNNGEMFTGDVSKVFDDGYRHGEMQHSGHGMYSAKKTMLDLGGDIEFSSSKIVSSISEYTTQYRITLPKNKL